VEILLLVLTPITTFVFGVIATRIADGRKYRREDAVSWIQERMATYSTFVSECDDSLEAALERGRIEGPYSWINGPYEARSLRSRSARVAIESRCCARASNRCATPRDAHSPASSFWPHLPCSPQQSSTASAS
jgi:hypothetical protein